MIKNKTKNKVISENFVYLKRFFSKSRGFIGKSNFEAVIFTTRFGVHTFGLKFPIDVLILNNQRKIVSIRENLKPNRVFLWNPRYNLVIELEKGTVRKSKTEINDFLEISL
ncbi:MAG: DUF192 domain-containing protein [Patescibacteria group bacterium]|nr:DUF192 domain-containing protein [Patescibacteria group bacterium]